MSEEPKDGVIFTPKVEDDMGRIDEFPEPKTLAEEIEAEVQEELKNEGAVEGAIEGATEGAEEEKELTEEEKHEIFINALKESKIRFRPIKQGTKTVVTETTTFLGRKRLIKSKVALTNVTTNQFGADYRKKRQRKNRMQKASRKANR